ncbi:MAG TPA: peptide ABC transporter substrate-binding protein [Steroidobacteraceae bacterium]|nr:peptide ABC transporter substrate-binding protein [Steroidobacteraceae bacterium]
MKQRARLLCLAALTVAVTFTGACQRKPASVEQGGTGHEPVVLNRGNGHEPESLDPQRARTDSELTILRDVYEGLTALDADAKPAPAAAREWSVSTDGRVYTFRLRDGLRWSNGDPVVALDFVQGLRRLVDPATASPYGQILDVIENAPDIGAGRKPPDTLGVSAPDDHTVVITLSTPAPYVPGVLAHPSTYPVHRPTLERLGREFARPGNAVSNGAFALKEWIVGSHIVASRNVHYWNNAGNQIDVINYQQIPDQGAELLRYRSGELDVTYTVPPAQFKYIRENLGAELRISPQLSTYYYGYNLYRAPFKDNTRLRLALSMVIDRERLTESVTGRGELPAYGWVPVGVANYDSQKPDWAALPFAQRVARAKELYAAAGYSPAHPLRTQIRYNIDESHTRIAVAIASMWKEYLGVETELLGEEFKVLLQNIDRHDVTQVFRSSWIGDYNDAYTFAQYLKSDFGINLPGYKNPQYDALLVRAASEVDQDRRRDELEAAERLMLLDQPVIPLYFYVNKHLVKPYVEGWHNNVMNVQYSKNLVLRKH